MDLTRPMHGILLGFLGLGLIVGGLGVVLLTDPIFSAFSLGLVLVCISLFLIPSNSHFLAAAQLLIYVGAINVLIIFVVMFMNDSEYYNDFSLCTVGDGITSLVCTSIFVSLITTIPDMSWYGVIWTTRSNHILEHDLINIVSLIGTITMAILISNCVSIRYISHTNFKFRVYKVYTSHTKIKLCV
ncbi:hypothetical protein MKW94_001237 [Papaver nudicaule]|uniref:NAD(P)H-quinone oxidoreductase subunit 6, chloroplastic n=1 Tax=Papaver nudicaule TaxID=74823 RepID=A0AA41V304_PAPNU|nr:hypothetical protein [Papaver nudicaule]